ncbi:MAG: cobyric acid synthase, partial [Deltaproteobacteria bacterium]|nr:cobyric acid synthase [Deltaproteobacteria bacterium]
LNSFVTADGAEMGRAQVVQAEASCIEPTVEMNPVLLKPEADNRSQVVLRGKPIASLSAIDYYSLRERLWKTITESLDSLSERYDLIVVEGAGSPAEINLKDRDMVNMRVALHCSAPVILAADIDRGGVFASLVGTLHLLEPSERAQVKAFVINKFRGDLSLLEPGLRWLEERTGIPVAGVIPYFHDIHIAEEDSVSLERRRSMKFKQDFVLDIAVMGLPHISNFDDFDPLEQEDQVRLRYVELGDSLGSPDLIIIPGTKNTMDDLAQLREAGFGEEILQLARAGTPVIGICGGYQMLGHLLLNPDRIESNLSEMPGLGLLPVTTTFSSIKSTHQVRGHVAQARGILSRASSTPLIGYEIHMGRTRAADPLNPFCIRERSRRACNDLEGCLSLDGNIIGTYLHGLFHNQALRRAILVELADRKGVSFRPTEHVASKEQQYDKLAGLVRRSLDMNCLYKTVELRGP